MNAKSSRNKTIDFPIEKAGEYLSSCVKTSDFDGKKLNVTINGDFFETIKKIPDGYVDLLIVDPPYDMNKNFHGNKFKKVGYDKYLEYTRAWIEAVKPKLKNTASIYVCCDWRSSISIGKIIEDNFILRNRITWSREKGRGAKNNWKNSMEDIYYATVSDDFTFNLDAVKVLKKVLAPYKENGVPKDWHETENGKFRKTCPSNFWDDIAVPYWSMAENTAHPTQKPEKLIAKLILASSNKNDLVLDPFNGSGTTCVVAKKLDRKYIGLEQNPLYCAWAIKRIMDSENDKSIQGYSDGVFWERNSKPDKKNN
jgi:site-specific DNA-methyltransferase (adenine-specific)